MSTPVRSRRMIRSSVSDLVAHVGLEPSARDRYARDPFAHLDDGHVKILDLVTMQEIELRAWPNQREVVTEWIDIHLLETTGVLRFRNLHVEKSRQMGISWILAWLYLWAMLYHAVPLGYQHMNAGEVDDGGEGNTVDSFFGRIRYMHDSMPERYQQALMFRGGNNPSIRHRQKPTALIRGEGATPNPGRGGRFLAWVFDEAAHLSWGEAAHASISRAVPEGRLYNSTPEGEGNLYFRLRDERPAGMSFIRIHWSQHPVYSLGMHVAGSDPRRCTLCAGNEAAIPWIPQHPRSHRFPGKLTSPWYDAAVSELTDEQVASELDIDYVSSLTARIYREFTDDVHVLPSIPYDGGAGVEFAWDYGLDVTAVAILQDFPGELRQIGELEIGDSTPDEVVPALLETLAELGVPLGLLKPHWTRQMRGVGDPSGEGRELGTNRSFVDNYRALGFSIVSPTPGTSVAATVTAVKRLLMGRPKPYRISAATCPKTIKHWKLNRWPTDRQGVRKPGGTRPEDDVHNHMMRALAYYVHYRWPAPAAVDAIEGATARLRENVPDKGLETGLSYDTRL